MNTLINELDPKERAMLYAAMLMLKEHAEDNYSAAISQNTKPFFKSFWDFTQRESRALMNKLFDDCFPEDLDFAEHFAAHWKNQHNTTLPGNEISAAIEAIA